MANKQIAGTVELTTGVFLPTSFMPVYDGENGATELNLTIYKNGIAYSKPEGATLRMYFFYETEDEMTLSILMTVTGNVATCDFRDYLLAIASRPKCVVQELDAERTTVFCSFYVPVSKTRAGKVIAISPVTPDMMHMPTINTVNGHWMVWDETSETYVDSGVNAAGDGNYVAFISQSLTEAQKQQARTNIGAGAGTGTSTAILKGNGTGGFVNAAAGTDYISPTTGSAIQKADGAGELETATPGTDYSLPSVYSTATLLATGWVGASAPYTQVVTATGVLSGTYPVIDLVQSAVQSTAENELASYLYVLDGKIEVSADNQITATCYNSKPTVDLNIRLVVVK